MRFPVPQKWPRERADAPREGGRAVAERIVIHAAGSLHGRCQSRRVQRDENPGVGVANNSTSEGGTTLHFLERRCSYPMLFPMLFPMPYPMLFLARFTLSYSRSVLSNDPSYSTLKLPVNPVCISESITGARSTSPTPNSQ